MGIDYKERVAGRYAIPKDGRRTGNRDITWEIDKNGCWNCTSHVPNTYGYPQIRYKRKFVMLSHVIYELHFGELREGLQVLHHCDNPKCLNPDHLFAGTNKDNVDDMVMKNRQSHQGSPGMKGEKHPQAKLNDISVVDILRDRTLNLRQMAKKYGVSMAVISKIRCGGSWKHIKREVAE